MSHLTTSNSTSSLYAHITGGIELAVSDGSFFPNSQVGAYSWIIYSPGGMEWIKGGGIIPGWKLDQSAYPSELGGN